MQDLSSPDNSTLFFTFMDAGTSTGAICKFIFATSTAEWLSWIAFDKIKMLLYVDSTHLFVGALGLLPGELLPFLSLIEWNILAPV